MKKLLITEFLNTISISQRDKWVVERILANDSEKRTAKDWKGILKDKCKGIVYTQPKQ